MKMKMVPNIIHVRADILVSHISSAILKWKGYTLLSFDPEHSENSDWLECARSKVKGEYPFHFKMADEM
jgi:hypothetical protein